MKLTSLLVASAMCVSFSTSVLANEDASAQVQSQEFSIEQLKQSREIIKKLSTELAEFEKIAATAKITKDRVELLVPYESLLHKSALGFGGSTILTLGLKTVAPTSVAGIYVENKKLVKKQLGLTAVLFTTAVASSVAANYLLVVSIPEWAEATTQAQAAEQLLKVEIEAFQGFASAAGVEFTGRTVVIDGADDLKSIGGAILEMEL